jgi:CRISPR-associated protein Cmr3
MMRLFIEPTDVWLFRDGKPFDAGSDHRARSLFPPFPSTMQGAIRSKTLALSGVDLDDYAHRRSSAEAIASVIGWPGEGFGRLQLRGPFIARRENDRIIRYFPRPFDLVQVENGKTSECKTLSPLIDSPFTNNAPESLNPPWIRSSKKIEDASGWLSEDELLKYLNGETFILTHANDLFVRESRFGIKLNDHERRVDEGHLYEVEFIRPGKDVGLVVDVVGLECWPSSGFLAIGGEGRGAHYRRIDPSENEISVPGPNQNGKTCFKLYFATPAYFDGGWRPAGRNLMSIFGKNVKFVSAAFDRPQMIGGAKIDKKSQSSGLFQKPMRRYLPAGSVYFLEADGQISYNGNPITETPKDESDLGQIGFGQIFIGKW